MQKKWIYLTVLGSCSFKYLYIVSGGVVFNGTLVNLLLAEQK